MSKTVTAPLVCQICKKPKSPNSGMIAELIRPSLLEFIKKKLPDFDSKAFICFEDLGKFRKDYIKEVLEDEIGSLSASGSQTTSQSSAGVGNFSLHLALSSSCGSVRTPCCSLRRHSILIHSFS